ncbi:MAG: hypothetical protein HY811_00810 [Planctomycetes bacterium]|nr:hypothetical protein [Planctomycetota bacterium]
MNNNKANKSGLACPPLSTDDLVVLRGKPMAKIIQPINNHPHPAKDSFPSTTEEWVYISIRDNSNEHYFFENQQLVGWKKTAV